MRTLVMICGLATVLILGVTFTVALSCTPSSAKGSAPAAAAGSGVISAVPVAPAGRHLGMEYATKYMADKFKVLDKPDCAVWEDNGYNHLQTALCSISDVILVYCHAGDGKPPTCEITIDKRPKPPEAGPKAKK